MSSYRRLIGVALASLACAGLVVALTWSSRDGRASSTETAAGGAPWAVTKGLLTVPEVQSLDGGQQLSDQAQAARLDPSAVFARERSRTAFRYLSAAAAARVVRQESPRVLATAPTGLVHVQGGGRVERYLSSDSARIALPDGKHAMAVSMGPIATRTGSGGYHALDLALHEDGAGFTAADPAVTVRIPKILAAGVKIPSSGVSLTPVGTSGTPLQGSGSVERAAVLYANTQTDTDTAVKATPSGFETDTLLRSVSSPEQLSFQMGLPAGAKLTPVAGGAGASRVVLDGKTVAIIPTPTAQDAEGTAVPVSTSVSGATIDMTVAHRNGDYRYPITVDPTVIDTGFAEYDRTNWRQAHSSAYHIFAEMSPGVWHMYVSRFYEANDWGATIYPTQGESHIYELSMESAAANVPENVENHMLIIGAPVGEHGLETAVREASLTLSKNYARAGNTVCVSLCSSAAGSAANVAAFWVNATGSFNGSGTPEGPTLYTGSVYIAQNNGPSASLDTTHEYLGIYKNALYGSGSWIREGAGAAEVDMGDPGVGVSKAVYTVTGGAKWTKETASASGPVQYPEATGQRIILSNYNPGGLPVALPDGEPTVEAQVFNGMGSTVTTSTKLKVDNTAPAGLTLTGLPESGEISDSYRALKLTGKATDGSGATISSGVASLKLAVDGQEVGSPNGSCSTGPCTATGEWSINAEEYGAGKHVLTETATDVAGNVAKSETPFTVHHATPTAFGPGTVNPVTGDYDIEESDVSISTAGPPLQVTRNYDSREPTNGAEGPFGAPWSVSFGGAQTLERNPSTKSMILTSASGGLSTFVYKSTGHYDSPTGDKNVVLTANSAETEFTLTDKGATTVFRHTSGDGENIWRPGIATSSGGTNTTQYIYQAVGGVVEPYEELAPVPAGVSCSSELKRGCRALTFGYGTSTSATGEAPSEWGSYTGRIARVNFTSYEPASKTMLTQTVLQYSYDKKGRLRAVWDPGIWPGPLKRTFGYDTEGHVTAIASAGQEPWILGYGTASLDASAGRLVTGARPVASTALGSGIAPANTAAPSVSAPQPVVGHSDRAFAGTWTNSPLRYGYQWQRCNASGGECAVIAGAINSAYTPVSADVGHTLVVQVTATDSGGSTTASSAATAVCAASTELVEYATVGEGSPWAITAGPDGNLWATMEGNPAGEIDKVTTSGAVSQYAGVGSGTQPRGITVGSDGNLWFTAYGFREIGKMNTSGTLLAQYSAEAAAGDFGVTLGPDGNVWYVAYKTGKVDKITTAGVRTAYGLPAGAEPYDIAEGSDGNLWFTEEGTNKIGKITTSGTITEYSLPAGSLPREIVTGPDKNLWFTEFGTNKIGKITTSGTITEYALASGTGPEGIVGGPKSQVWFTESTAAKVGSITSSGSVTTYTLPTGSAPKGIAVGTEGNLWIAEYGTKKIAKLSPEGSYSEGAEGPETSLPTSATSTIEYGVPVSGAGAPYAMGSADVAKWAQTDIPAEATAIFPPDEPMGWPAGDYRRATVDYLDGADRLVNVVSPGGTTATSEYNSYNDVTRTLSPDDRATALKEGAKSAEVSQTLDTQSTYGSEGAELLSALGPLHTVKLASGASVSAREHTVYSYDEHAPSGGPYRLVTKVATGAQIAGEPEADVRTTTKSYGAQNNLGWVLRKPTSTQTDPSGLKLTHTTVYDPTSGNITETRSPAAGAPGEETLSGYIYRTTFGSLGSGNGQVSKPTGAAVDAEGNLWVADTENNRVEEFSSGGTFVQKFGTLGTGNGQLKKPTGITVDGEGNLWVVDSGNNRVEKFSRAGVYLSQFGSEGAGYLNGAYFKSPTAITYSSKTSWLYVADTGNNVVRIFTLSGEYLFKVGAASGAAGSKEGQFNKEEGVAVDGSGNIWVADTGNNRVQELGGEAGWFIKQFGSGGSGEEYLHKPKGIAIDSEGNLFVADANEHSRIVVYTSAGVRKFQFGSEGTGTQNMNNPAGLALDSSNNAYVLDTGNSRLQKWSPAALVHESTGTGGTHGTQTIYYTVGENAQASVCGEHAEWAGLPCETKPAAQPETSGVPNLPVTTVTYNVWDEPLVSTRTVGADTRTATNTYDGASRLLTTAVTSSVGTALPTLTTEYSTETGMPIKQSTTAEGTTRTIEGVFNKLGQVTSYKDADGSTSTAAYDLDGRKASVNDGKGTQTLTYDTTTGLLAQLTDSAAGTFTATYDAEGNLVTAGYPNGMSVNHTLDATGDEVGVEYVKTTHCSSGCTWYSEVQTPSIHGQAMSQTSTLSSESYTYDATGRLTKAQDTPAGEGCTARIYAYDEETNIQSLTTRAPGGEGKCATEGGTAANHSYDTANRLTDAGISYDAFGDITKLPAGDAGGSALTSTYYADETLASQSQGGETLGYYLDPAGRTRQTVATGTTNSTITSHYAGGGRTPAWTEDTFGKWTRNISGLEGTLAAIQTNGEAPVLQIEDLHGSVVGTASLSETATAPLSKGDSTEYGVPRTSSPPKYSWMGGFALPTEFPSGIVAMGARSYAPVIGRFLQPDPIEGGSANAYSYTYGDPVNTADPSGEFTVATPGWVVGFLSKEAEAATEAAIQRAAEEQAAREEAEQVAKEAEEAWEESYIAAREAASSGGGGGGHRHSGGGVATASSENLTNKILHGIESHIECESFLVSGTAGGFLLAGPEGAELGAAAGVSACGTVAINELTEYGGGGYIFMSTRQGPRRLHMGKGGVLWYWMEGNNGRMHKTFIV